MKKPKIHVYTPINLIEALEIATDALDSSGMHEKAKEMCYRAISIQNKTKDKLKSVINEYVEIIEE